jgi:glutamate/tyrosine decarboxylase-like PLP-dependent enzyme
MPNNRSPLDDKSQGQKPEQLSHWNDNQLERFLRLRQELFLDPVGSNRKRFEEAAVLLQRALFAWYFSMPGEFPGLLSLVQQYASETRQLRKEELLTLHERRFSLHVPAPEIPAVESSVSENQWQKIFGSFNTSYEAQRLFERFLSELDEYTNPSLRFNHRYLGELLPHDNMVSYFAATVATFLNENAIIGKVSPCVTHMELAAMVRLAQLVGWEGRLEIGKPEDPAHQFALPLQRLPTPYPPAQNSDLWEREQPTGLIVGDGTIANISALLIARNATFNYLLGWGEATQSLGPDIAWQIIKDVYEYDRIVVITSKGGHYSVPKASHMAGVGPLDVIDVAGSKNPWILDGAAFEKKLNEIENETKADGEKKKTLLLAVVLVAGKTETGYIDKIDEVAKILEKPEHRHHDLKKVLDKRQQIEDEIKSIVDERLMGAHYRKEMLIDSYISSQKNPKYSGKEINRREKIQVEGARYNRPFLHVDAAHGGAFLTVPYLRNNEFRGIHLADTVTLDGHKMFYCYYPCGGLLIRTTRWARSLHASQSSYISEDTSHEAYGEDRWYLDKLKEPKDQEEIERDKRKAMKEGEKPEDVDELKKRRATSEMPWIYPGLYIGHKEAEGLDAARSHNDRPAMAARSELRHLPFTASLEGSRGCQGIMQMYFNLSTIGFDGYRSLLEWTYLLSRRCAEAVSLGRVYVRPITEKELPTKEWMGNGKDWAIQDGAVTLTESDHELEPRRIVPVLGGRLLRLSDGSCNQLLISYVPRDIAMRIASQGVEYWKHLRKGAEDSAKPGSTNFWQTMHYLWRVNEHLWVKYLYANPAFTYYVGHTEFEPLLPNKKGSSLFREGDLKDPASLAVKLRDACDPLSQYLQQQFSPDTQRLLEQHDGSSPMSESLQSALVDELDQRLTSSGLFDEQRFAQVKLTEKARSLIKQKPQGDDLIRLNRLLLEEAYPLEIVESHKKDREQARSGLEKLLCDWNVWTRWEPEPDEVVSSLFREDDLIDPACLALKLLYSKDSLSEHLRTQLPKKMLQQLKTYTGSDTLPNTSHSALIGILNHLLKRPSLFEEKSFAAVELNAKTRSLIEHQPQGADLIHLNRLLLERAYPHLIAKHPNEEKNWVCPFFNVLAEEVQNSSDLYSKGEMQCDYREGSVRFFAHKIVVMHPYTDESILSDLLGKIMFWGERSAEAVQAADATCQDWLGGKKQR